jgi:hypothetical protein
MWYLLRTKVVPECRPLTRLTVLFCDIAGSRGGERLHSIAPLAPAAPDQVTWPLVEV